MARAGRKKAGNDKHHLSSRFPQLIKTEIEKRKIKGEKATYADIFEELANYIGCSINMINGMKDEKVNPSLITALKIAEYFNVRVEDIWSTNYNSDYVDDRERCQTSKCGRIVFAKGLCYKHYADKRNEEQRRKKSCL